MIQRPVRHVLHHASIAGCLGRPALLLAAIAAIGCIVPRWSLGADETAQALRVALFEVDASPPVGSPLAYDPTQEVQAPLSCRGLVLLGAGKPIVLCAVDWIGIGNDGYDVFRQRLAQAAGTDPSRVALHCLHQHDAPVCDFSVVEVLRYFGLEPVYLDSEFARGVIERASAAVASSLADARRVTHVGWGTGRVEKVASNRRILGPDGKVLHVRWTATTDPAVRAYPAGVIDPLVRCISFWDESEPIVVLTYYATHPQSYYRTGKANPDFPGLARQQREEVTGVRHIHFNGAGGNIGAGKWNDGAPENRQLLADRLALGMTAAWESTERSVISAADVGYFTTEVQLPPGDHLDREQLEAKLRDREASVIEHESAAADLVWLQRTRAGHATELGCLRLDQIAILNMPGELFVEYQLAAQHMRPDLHVAMAAYGDYGPGYIGTEIAYSQGGYETTPPASRVAPAVEGVLTVGMEQLLSSIPVSDD